MNTKARRTIQNGQIPHIGIIGAGLAGLRCADVLLEHGFQVTILEGRDRIGGRLYQDRLANGVTVDVGPNWVHGTDNNSILDIAKETNTAMGSWDTGSYVFNEDGELYSLKEGERYSEMMWDIVQAAFKHSNKNSAEIDPNESLLDFFKVTLKELIPESTENWQRKREIVLQMADLWGAFVGSPVERQSLKFFWLEECIEGENLYCAGTYAKILAHIAAPALKGATINYDTLVHRIHARSSPENPVKATLSDGTQLSFDELVVTCPLGWLQKNPQAFDPALPPSLTKAINSISYGCLEKVYISFPKAFWLTPDPNNAGRKVQGFAQWLSPRFAPDTNPERWTIEVVELASLGPDVSHPTLLFYIYGAQSAHIVNTVKSLSSAQERDKFLYGFFSPYYTKLPNYSPDSPDCQPVCSYATTWLADALAGNGSYSNFQVGLQEGDEDIKTMREGWKDQGVWLAGEHTSPFVALGTATGAYWSGESVGRQLAEGYGRSAVATSSGNDHEVAHGSAS
ncbi:flavin containing amine oxidoreductase [Diaporthe amygdali]|uniref:flavin containing amine oxidoreductase n=1 Tax=Phomopsis amygdali TaxID=1214568 RepID=UPI0022FE83C0|nr:flavin containing amine oxidoreductase [Diaporthe amygdali]KAJ0109082.1 flavin containing amine oxidoreductase [Diaporthe amygdali]